MYSKLGVLDGVVLTGMAHRGLRLVQVCVWYRLVDVHTHMCNVHGCFFPDGGGVPSHMVYLPRRPLALSILTPL